MQRTPRSLLFSISLALIILGCSSTKTSLPLRAGPPPVALSSSALVGRARAFQWTKDRWTAAPSYDYDFVVVETRFADRREAVKEIHRRDPRYGGLAGRRDQSLFFMVRVHPAPAGGNDLEVEGTLGRGSGHEDASGAASFEMVSAKRGIFVPYDTIRITQRRPDTSGRLVETVELFSKKRGREEPFMKIEEEAVVYRPSGPGVSGPPV